MKKNCLHFCAFIMKNLNNKKEIENLKLHYFEIKWTRSLLQLDYGEIISYEFANNSIGNLCMKITITVLTFLIGFKQLIWNLYLSLIEIVIIYTGSECSNLCSGSAILDNTKGMLVKKLLEFEIFMFFS